MKGTPELIPEVAAARFRVVRAVNSLTVEQGAFKPGPDRWSIQEVVEHLVLAEQAGIQRIWQAAEGVRRGQPVWTGEPVHRGLPIEEIIAKTWEPKETAPPNATPQGSGPLACWVACLEGCQPVLEALGQTLRGLDLSQVIFPHFLSGPLDARQRLEFLRFHMDRHLRQIQAIKDDSGFPR
jgi:hypothetical protein